MKVKIYMQTKELKQSERLRAMLEDIARAKGISFEAALCEIMSRSWEDMTGNKIDFKPRRPQGHAAALYTPFTIEF